MSHALPYRDNDLAAVPGGERGIVAPAQPFDPGFASMHASAPLEPVPVKSFFYPTYGGYSSAIQ